MGCQNGAETPGALRRDLAPQKREWGRESGFRTAGLRKQDTVPPGEMEPLSRLSPPPLPECNLPKPLIKSILEVIKVSPKICSFSKLSLKQNLWSGEIQAVEEQGWAGREGG